jgi:signal transduction histidine kinase
MVGSCAERSRTEVVGGAVDANREAIDAASLAISVYLADPHLVLNVDATRFSQILSNVIQNAAKFPPVGEHISVNSATVSLVRESARRVHPIDMGFTL